VTETDVGLRDSRGRGGDAKQAVRTVPLRLLAVGGLSQAM
jgi:hypothetical protein